MQGVYELPVDQLEQLRSIQRGHQLPDQLILQSVYQRFPPFEVLYVRVFELQNAVDSRPVWAEAGNLVGAALRAEFVHHPDGQPSSSPPSWNSYLVVDQSVMV